MAEEQIDVFQKRKLPKLMACTTKTSIENFRNKAMYNIDTLDAKGIRRLRMPLHECLVLEMRETGYIESANFLRDLLYDNMQLLTDDDLSVVVDLSKKDDYLEKLSEGLQKAEAEKEKGNPDKEARQFLTMALFYSEREKGILWLAERLFLVAMAVASQHLIDGGRLKACCKYHYAKFLIDKFPELDTEHAYDILIDVRNSSIGRGWPLYEGGDGDTISGTTVIRAAATQLHRILLTKARKTREDDAPKSETLCRLAETRAMDAQDIDKRAEAVVEIAISQFVMKDLNNALKTFERAYRIYFDSNNIEGLCNTNMHIAAVMQRLGDHVRAEKILLEMGTLAITRGLRRHLGRALYLLGELNLSLEKPDLATQYFKEAFGCFMAYEWIDMNIFEKQKATDEISSKSNEEKKQLEELSGAGKDSAKIDFNEVVTPSDIHHAEKSRLMTAISAGQERMASYFDLLRKSKNCDISRLKTIEWKLSKQEWWTDTQNYDFQSCPCPVHKRTPLDAVKLLKKYLKENEEMANGEELGGEQMNLESH